MQIIKQQGNDHFNKNNKPESFAFMACLVYKSLSPKEFVYK